MPARCYICLTCAVLAPRTVRQLMTHIIMLGGASACGCPVLRVVSLPTGALGARPRREPLYDTETFLPDPKRRFTDRRLRELERAARSGDLDAQRRLSGADRVPTLAVFSGFEAFSEGDEPEKHVGRRLDVAVGDPHV